MMSRNTPKIKRNGRITKLLIAGALLLCVGLLAACGGDDSESKVSVADFGRDTVASCLEQGGAQFAKSTDELDFLVAAESNEEVSKVGFAQDPSGELVVDTWHKATFEGRPPEWIVWIGRPFGESSTPAEIASSDSSESYVAYSVRPSKEQRANLEGCIDTESDDGQPAVTIDKEDLEEVTP